VYAVAAVAVAGTTANTDGLQVNVDTPVTFEAILTTKLAPPVELNHSGFTAMENDRLVFPAVLTVAPVRGVVKNIP